MKRTQLLKNIPSVPVPENLRINPENVYGVSQVAEYDGKEYLNVDLYYMGQLAGRYFADRDGHAANIQGKWYTGIMENTVRLCMGMDPVRGYDGWYNAFFVWHSKADNETAREYLGVPLEYYERHINEKKARQAAERKQNRINARMAKVPSLPEGLKDWLNKKIFPEEYIFTEEKKERTYYSCTACGTKSWKKSSWKNCAEIMCPKCGQPVKVKNRKKQEEKKIPVVVLQTIDGNEWVERQLLAKCTWDNTGKNVEVYEEMRAIAPKGAHWGTVYYGEYYESDEKSQCFWDKNQANKRWRISLLYPGNLHEIRDYVKMNCMDILAENGIRFKVNDYIVVGRAKPWVEYLVKAGLTKLTEDILSGWIMPSRLNYDGKKLTEFLKLDGSRVNRLKRLNGGVDILKWLQYEQQCQKEGSKKKISDESLEYIAKRKLDVFDCKVILKTVGSVNRMVNYLKKQKDRNVVQTWVDYLSMAREEGFNLTDDIVRLPKDLKGRHDELVTLRQRRRNEEKTKRQKEKYQKLDADIAANIPTAARYYWQNEKYIFIPAGTCEELVKEGQELHHCVGSSTNYMTKMAEGRTWIIFLRKKEDINKAYYTIEVDMRDDCVLQFYSEFDRRPEKEEIQKLLRTWRKAIRKKAA